MPDDGPNVADETATAGETTTAGETATADETATGSSARPWAERMLDQALPEELDWQQKVQSYPLTALLVATGLGFALGRSRGAGLFSALTGFAADRLTATISNALDTSDR
jgi:hypothetical protein